MATLNPAALELHRGGITLTQVAVALERSVQSVSMQLRGERKLDPRLLLIVRALAGPDTAMRVHAAILEASR